MKFSQQALEGVKSLEHIVVQHSSFIKALETIENVMQIGMGTGIHTGVRLIAPSGAGKSQLIKHLEITSAKTSSNDSELQIIYTSLKENPSVSQLQGDLLRWFGYPLQGLSRQSNNNDVNQILVRAIAQNQVKLLGFDEFQHIFTNGGSKVATIVLDWLKRLMNSTKVPVLLLGTEMLERLDGIDPQLTSRIPTVVKLNHFRPDGEWVGFLQSLSNGYKNFDLSPIVKERNPKKLFLATNGSLRLLKSLLAFAVGIGITKGEAVMSEELLGQAFLMMFGQVSAEENPFVS